MPSLPQRVAQLGQIFALTRRADPKLVPLIAAAALAGLTVGLVPGLLTGHPVLGTVFGVVLALLGALVVLGRRSSVAALAAIEGQPGAAAAVLQSVRGYRVTPAVAITRKQDFVHRAVGPAGVLLVGEGSAARTTALLKQERRRVGRIIGDTPVHEINVGDGDGQVPLRQLQGHVMRLPRKLKPPAVAALDQKLRALGHADLPMPKGPMPRGTRIPRR